MNAYQIPTDTHEFMTPDGLLSRRAIAVVEPFMAAFIGLWRKQNREGLAGITPKMGLFPGYWLAAVKKAGSNPAHSTSITGSCFA